MSSNAHLYSAFHTNLPKVPHPETRTPQVFEMWHVKQTYLRPQPKAELPPPTEVREKEETGAP